MVKSIESDEPGRTDTSALATSTTRRGLSSTENERVTVSVISADRLATATEMIPGISSDRNDRGADIGFMGWVLNWLDPIPNTPEPGGKSQKNAA